MSKWWEIEDEEDVALSIDGKEVQVLFDSDYDGNNYVSIPVWMLKKILSPEIPHD